MSKSLMAVLLVAGAAWLPGKAEAQGRTYMEWRKDIYGNVYCAELTRNGDQVQRVNNDVCRQEVGSRYERRSDIYGNRYCAEVTPEGDQIQRVDNRFCRPPR